MVQLGVKLGFALLNTVILEFALLFKNFSLDKGLDVKFHLNASILPCLGPKKGRKQVKSLLFHTISH